MKHSAILKWVGVPISIGLSACVWTRRPETKTPVAAQPAAAPEKESAADLAALETMADSLTDKVRFDSGSSALTPESREEIGKFGDLLAKYPEVKITVHGFTDSAGSETVNAQLSEARADNVGLVLQEHGVKLDQFEKKGLGESSPIASNDSDQGRAENRRVEVAITETVVG